MIYFNTWQQLLAEKVWPEDSSRWREDKSGFKFSDASSFPPKNPKIASEDVIQNYINFQMSDQTLFQIELETFMGPIQHFLNSYDFDNSLEHVDAIFLEQFLPSFLNHRTAQ